MKYALHGRTEKTLELERKASFKTYRAAVIEGQKKYGHGNFMVVVEGAKVGEGYVPSREEQLLEEPLE